MYLYVGFCVFMLVPHLTKGCAWYVKYSTSDIKVEIMVLSVTKILYGVGYIIAKKAWEQTRRTCFCFLNLQKNMQVAIMSKIQ